MGDISLVRVVQDIVGKNVGAKNHSLDRTGIPFPFEIVIYHGNREVYRPKGLVGMEGKDYVVRDGDVILFRFNV